VTLGLGGRWHWACWGWVHRHWTMLVVLVIIAGVGVAIGALMLSKVVVVVV